MGARILVAEDNSTNQVVALGILKKLGLPYDLLLMDVQMPVMDGLEATRQIRRAGSSVSNRWIPIIAMTAHALRGDRERFLEVRMNDYVSKPTTRLFLMDVLECWLPRDKDEPGMVGEYKTPSPRLPSSDAVVLDGTGMMDRLMNDESMAQKLIKVFLDDMPAQIYKLRCCLDSSDEVGAERRAHELKCAAAYVGGESLRAKR